MSMSTLGNKFQAAICGGDNSGYEFKDRARGQAVLIGNERCGHTLQQQTLMSAQYATDGYRSCYRKPCRLFFGLELPVRQIVVSAFSLVAYQAFSDLGNIK